MPRDSPRAEAIFVYAAVTVGVVFFYASLIRFYDIALFVTPGIDRMFGVIEHGFESLFKRLTEPAYYPPLYTLFTDLATWLTGADARGLYLINAGLLAAAAYYLAYLGRQLGMGVFAFLPALTMLWFTNGILYYLPLSLEMMLLLTMVATTAHLVAGRNFMHRRHAIGVGFWAGMAMMTKWTVPLYLAGVMLFFAVWLVFDFSRRRFAWPKRVQWVNLGYAAGVFALVTGWWYVFLLPWDWFFTTTGNAPTFLDYTFVDMLQHNLRVHLGGYLGLRGAGEILIPLFVIAVLLSRERWRTLAVAVLAVFVPVVILSTSTTSEHRYFLPLLPAGMLMLAMPVALLRERLLAWIIAGLLLATFMHLHFVDIQWARRELPTSADTEALVNYLDRHRTDFPRKDLLLGVHPLWDNGHIKPEYLNWHFLRRAIHPRKRSTDSASFRAENWYPQAYGRFHDTLLQGLYDIVLLDCGPTGDCLTYRPEWIDRMVREVQQKPYIDALDGVHNPKFDRATIAVGLDYLHEHYHLALAVPLPDETRSLIYIHRDIWGK